MLASGEAQGTAEGGELSVRRAVEEHPAVVSGSATGQMERNATESVMVVVIQSKEVELFFWHSFKEL